jgi:hypothetical protein
VTLFSHFPRELAPEEWVALLRDEDGAVRGVALEVLLRRDLDLGPEGREARRGLLRELAQALRHPAPEARTQACRDLARLGPDAIPALIEAVHDKEAWGEAMHLLQQEFGLPPQAEAAIRAAFKQELDGARQERQKNEVRERYRHWLDRLSPPMPKGPAVLVKRVTEDNGLELARQKQYGKHSRAGALLALAEHGRQPPEVVHAILLLNVWDRTADGWALRDAWRQALMKIAPEVAAEMGLPG